jgi:hypothetical protein
MLHCDLKTRAPAAASCAWAAPASPQNRASTIPSRNEFRMSKALNGVAPGSASPGTRLLSGLWTQSAGPYSVAGKFFPSVDAWRQGCQASLGKEQSGNRLAGIQPHQIPVPTTLWRPAAPWAASLAGRQPRQFPTYRSISASSRTSAPGHDASHHGGAGSRLRTPHRTGRRRDETLCTPIDRDFPHPAHKPCTGTLHYHPARDAHLWTHRKSDISPD